MAEMVPGLVTLLAILLYFFMGLRVGQARGKYKIEAPAMTGHPEFERIVRVHLNTLEWLPLFLPSLWLFAIYVDPLLAGAVGVVWILGRIMFMQGYTVAANKRGSGFLIQAIANLILFAGAAIGLIWNAAGLAPLLT